MLQPPDWYTVGHQNTVWETYIPTDWVDPLGSTGAADAGGIAGLGGAFFSFPFILSLSVQELTAVQYALGDFVVRQVAIALDKSVADVAKCANRSMYFVIRA
jgi:hypothetical protein